uniref:Pericentrin n=1 Tax=Astyanax mexicanus TaxID=7994 RepID=W5KBH1_ASTMX
MDQDERQRKLEAGRAKLAHFRQRRAKSDSANSQKKTPKRKGQAVQANDRAAQEHRLEKTQTDHSHGLDNDDDSESLQPDGITGDLAACQNRRETGEADAPEWSSLPGDGVTMDQPVETDELLGEIIVTHTSKEQLKQLQAAVEKRNEIISQLSINLQAALMSRDQVQLEAQQLTGQIQELQLQLQQCFFFFKENEITTLQQKLSAMEDSLSHLHSAFTSNNMEEVRARLFHHNEQSSVAFMGPEKSLNSDADSVLILQQLRSELEEERQNTKRAQDRANNLQVAMDNLQTEKFEIEAQLTAVQVELEKAEALAQEAQKYKEEKEELNQDVARLDGLVQQLQSRLREEEEAGENLRSKHEADIANYELQLQTLEEERGMNLAQLTETHEAALKRLQEEHLEKVQHIQELLSRAQQHNQFQNQHEVPEVELEASLNWLKASKEQQNQEATSENPAGPGSGPSLDASVTEDQNELMERYLAMAVQHESSWVEHLESLEEQSLLEISEASKFELENESELVLESRISVHHEVCNDSNISFSVQPDQAEGDPPDLGGMSFSQAQWQSFTSTSKGLNESVDDVDGMGGIDLGKELLIQQCQDLTEQLEEKEKQLEVLQEEVRRSAEELDEARERWSKASEKLEEAKWELETEREKRLHCEEIISQKTYEQDNLKNKLSSLQSQQDDVCLSPDASDAREKDSIRTRSPSDPEDLLKELKEDKAKLVLQLKQQEQLVREIHEQKTAGDSVSSEVQALFGRQLSSLQAQRDQLILQLENLREKNQTTSVLLGQKTLEVDSANGEIQRLRAEVEEKVENLKKMEKNKTDVESKLMCLKQNLTNMEEALNQGAVEKAALEERLQAFEEQTRNMENVLESELTNFEAQLKAKDTDLEQMKEAKEKAEDELMEKENIFQKELTELKQSLEMHLNENEEEKKKLLEKSIALIRLVHEREHQRELSQQVVQQREELSLLKAELIEELRDSMEAAHQAELLQAQTQQALELEALRLSLTNLHTAQLELSQANLQKEKEAALSELQASLREKWAQESAMLQARQQFELERLREQHSEQETRVQLQHQKELGKLKCKNWEKQLVKERTSVEQKQTSKLEEEKIQWLQEFESERSELQKHLQETQQKLMETQAALVKAEANFTEAQDRLEELQRSKEQEIEHLESDLSQAWADRDSAARAVEELVTSHKVVLQEQQAHAQSLEEREKQLQQEVDCLHSEREALKSSSDKEIANLWSQLESMRASRQELGELKEQLLARSSRVDDIERLKQEFSQQRQDLKEQNEVELENLRTYFEQRLRSSEESHREEIALLQLRLVEGALEESVLKTGETSFLSDGKAEEERADALAEITEQLEKHKAELDALRLQLEEKHRQDLELLRCSMALSYKEELLQAHTELTDRYYSDIEQLNTKHALEIEQLRAKLSDNHIKDITKLRLQSAAEVARQVEDELEERTRVQTEEHQARLAQLASETERLLKMALRVEEAHQEERNCVNKELLEQSREEQAQLREQLQAQAEENLASLREELRQAALEERRELEQKLAQAEERLAVLKERLQTLQASLNSDESPQVVAVREKLQAQYESELRTAKNTMASEVKELNALLQEQTETKLKEALCRHQEEQRHLEEKFVQQREAVLREQQQHHDLELKAQKELFEQHISNFQSVEKECQELKLRHQEELDTLSSNHKAAVESLESDLSEKHQAELDKLQVVLEETNLAQLEALEAELIGRHKQELEELETRMLSNMDTLESTYLKEIQALREEEEEGLQKLRTSLKQQHAEEMERIREEELSVREKLRQELTRVHTEKISIMAAELSQAHQDKLSEVLSSQKATLDASHRSALETLQQHVLELEQQHSSALQEITALSSIEKEQLQQRLDALTAQHQQQLQELRGASAREIEALRRELEEETSRQRLHSLEEAELLKCQSEEQLQQKITQIKEESEQDKAAALEELERRLKEQHQQKELGYTEKMSQLTAQLQQLDTVVSQLRAEVSGLQGELEGKRSEMDTLGTLLQRRERESQEGTNLLAMLRDDLNTATQQRLDLQSAHDRLQRVFLEMLRVTMATEEHINRRLGAPVAGDCPGSHTTSTRKRKGSRDTQETEAGVDCSVFSSVTDEGLELSQQLCESLFSGPEGELDPEREELVLEPCTRLRTSIDKLLELVSESTLQLEQLHALQAAVNEQFREGDEARNALLQQHTQLVEQLDQESSLKSHLQLELHKAEGLIEGYVAEKAVLEETLQQKEAQEQRLVEELESTRAQLQELSEAHVLLQRQRDALSSGLGDAEKGGFVPPKNYIVSGLIELSGLILLTCVQEQAVEREHERDEFQQEIKNLEAQLKLPSKGHSGGDSNGQRVESLQALIKDKTEDYSVLLSAKEQWQRDLDERNDEIDKMASRIRELEQALLSSAEAGRAVTQLEQELQRYFNSLHRFPDPNADPGLREQLETLKQDLQSKKEQVELQLEQVEELEKALEVREEEVRQLSLQLELNTRESQANEEQLHLHITQLQETVSALRHHQEEKGEEDPMLQLPAALLEEKNLEIDHLNQQILRLQKELDTTKDNKVVDEKQAEIEELQAQVERLHGDQERLRQAKEEETEQLHEVIHKLQEELSQLDANRHEVSDPSPEPPDFPWSPRPQHSTEESLCHELSSQTLQSSRTRLKELQAELERSAEEKDALQRLLLSQEEQYGEQVEALGRSLGEEKGRLVVLEEEAEDLRLQLTGKEDEVAKLHTRLSELEDGEEHLNLQLKNVEERSEEVRKEMLREKEAREKLEDQVQELRQKAEDGQIARAELETQIMKLEELVQQSKTDISTLETGKKELYMERQALRKREGKLQEEIERLKQEVQSKGEEIQELNVELEERVTKQEETHKEVLTCAEETLAKAEAALREREEQLAHLRAEHDLLRAELAAVKEGLSTSTERAEKLREEGQTKDRALADLEVHNQHLRAELRGLQDDLAVQEEELAYQQRELDELRLRCARQEPSELPKDDHRFLEGLSRDASLSSPEVLRRLDCSEERHSRLHASHLSELSALRNTSLELGTKPSPMERERNELKRPLVTLTETDAPSTHSPTASPRSLSISENPSVIDSLDADKVQDLENLDVNSSHSPLCSASPVSIPEWASDGYGSNVSSELEAKLKLDLEHAERLETHFVEYLRCRGMDLDPLAESVSDSLHHSQELLSPELQAMLKRVYQESCRVLSLSHRPPPTGQPRPDSEEAPPPSWQRERRALQETVLSLRELLCRMAEREPKAEGDHVDWRRELLQAVRSVFDSEREWLHAQLQTVMSTNTHMDHTSLLEQLERLLQKQEEQQRRSLEQLLNADRLSLLAEIRSLHAQLHTCTLQSQEQLRELQDSFHTLREQGMQTQQKLQQQVDDLERQLQQEQTKSHDQHCRLVEEQSRTAEQHKQLEAEQKMVSELKAELQESSQLLHSACKSQEELQSQIHKLRLKLENEEQEHQTCVEAVRREQVRVNQLQEELQHERLNSQCALEQNTHTQEVQHLISQNKSMLNLFLEQERTAVSNLRSELQIEQSRCEALLAQERERTQLALTQLDEAHSHTAQLSDSLSRQTKEHARRLEEEARSQEAASAHDRKFIQDLRAQLDQERTQAEELAGMVERLQAQVLQNKRRQEEQREQDVQREQGEVTSLRAALEGLQAQRTEVSRSLEAERLRASQLQTELDSMKEKLRTVKEREEQREKQRKREKQAQEDKERRQERTREKLLELEVLRERDQQHLRQLQQTLADLGPQEKRLTADHLNCLIHSAFFVFVLQNSPSSATSSLVERLMTENSELAQRLASLSEEKISLKHTLSCLERDLHNLKRSEQTGRKWSSVTNHTLLAEKQTWQKEKAALQAALHRAETDLSKATASNENRPFSDLSNNKVQRLYEKYLRAESYRKSLVYQKRYLLLLLGGFQDCEQATLALIARMGAQPSLSQSQTSRPLSRFRSTVRVLIAISRLKFLTRKWQRATRKGSIGSATVNSAAMRTEVLKPQQTGAAFNSPPTRDHILTQRGLASPLVPPVKSPFRLHNRGYPSSLLAPSERTLTPSQDQERSLAEYIQHLEHVQHRLGAIQPGSPTMLSCTRKSDR